jgi:glycosyltransferase involved in cell wall biosynthesis
VDLDYFSPADLPNPFPSDTLPVVMTGRMDYRANINAVEWFAREVMPRVKIALPSARFYAVGANPPQSWRPSPEFAAVGQVKDIRPYILNARAIVAPLKIARGVQNKILEAMAMAKTVVATPEATRGLEANPGIDLLVADDPASFASTVVTAINRSDLGRNARRFVEQNHNWDRNLASLDRHLSRIGAEPAGAERVLRNAADTDRASAPADVSPVAEPAR